MNNSANEEQRFSLLHSAHMLCPLNDSAGRLLSGHLKMSALTNCVFSSYFPSVKLGIFTEGVCGRHSVSRKIRPPPLQPLLSLYISSDAQCLTDADGTSSTALRYRLTAVPALISISSVVCADHLPGAQSWSDPGISCSARPHTD